jgi:hypothetical protein
VIFRQPSIVHNLIGGRMNRAADEGVTAGEILQRIKRLERSRGGKLMSHDSMNLSRRQLLRASLGFGGLS